MLLSITAGQWDQIIAVNLRSMFPRAPAVAADKVARGSGSSSTSQGDRGEEGYAHYNASPSAMLLLTKTMSAELGRHGIRVNALCPGCIRTAHAAQEREQRKPHKHSHDARSW